MKALALRFKRMDVKRVAYMLAVMAFLALMVVPAFAQEALPTAEPVTEIGVSTGVGAGLSVLQQLGLIGILTIAAILFVAAAIMRRGKAMAR